LDEPRQAPIAADLAGGDSASPSAPTSAAAPAAPFGATEILPVAAGARAPTAPLWFLLVVTTVSLVADLWSKAWAMGYFEGVKRGDPRQLVLIDGYLALIYAKNRGGAWGLLQNENESLRRPFFLIVSVVAIVFIVTLYRRLSPGQTALKWGLPLVLGGALGNLVDRIRYGFVVDFIDAYMAWGGDVKHWPTFNVADIAICVGVGLMAIDMFTPRKVRQPSLLAPAGAAASGGADAGTADRPKVASPEPAVPAAEAAANAGAPAPADTALGLGDANTASRPETTI
jgi:signal peptidase II